MPKLFTESQNAGSLKTAGDGTFPVLLISPGQGASGYYSEEVIAQYAAEAWPKGTHVYLDHLKEGESRTPEKLLGILVEETTVAADGSAVNRFKPFKRHQEWIEEVAPYVGLSISVRGDGKVGTIDGKSTTIVESLDPHITNTVDLVSYAGRGGKFLESFLEEANATEITSTQTEPSAGAAKGNKTMTEEQIAELLALKPLVESLVAKMDARESAEADADANKVEVTEALASAVEAMRAVESAEVTPSVKDRLIERIKSGDFDVEDAIAADKTYREEIIKSLGAETSVNLNESIGAGIRSTEGAVDTNVNGW